MSEETPGAEEFEELHRFERRMMTVPVVGPGALGIAMALLRYPCVGSPFPQRS